MKKFTKVVEAYEMEMENYDDFAEEHAKVVIAAYLDGKLDGESLQSAFAKMVADNGLEEDTDGPQYIIKQALMELGQDILEQAQNIQLIGTEEVAPEPESDKHAELEAGRKPIGDNPGVM